MPDEPSYWLATARRARNELDQDRNRVALAENKLRDAIRAAHEAGMPLSVIGREIGWTRKQVWAFLQRSDAKVESPF